MIKYLVIIFCCLSCGNLSKNMIKQGKTEMRGGTKGSQTWNSDLVFSRYSWYQELTMVFDLLLARVDNTSPFYAWFSQSEKETFSKCADAMVSMTYALDQKKVSHQSFMIEMEKNGYNQLLVPGFESFLKLHPDFNKYSFSLYKVHGYCRPYSKGTREAQPTEEVATGLSTIPAPGGTSGAGILISFPSFQDQVLQ